MINQEIKTQVPDIWIVVVKDPSGFCDNSAWTSLERAKEHMKKLQDECDEEGYMETCVLLYKLQNVDVPFELYESGCMQYVDDDK